jgi:transposase-like protein
MTVRLTDAPENVEVITAVQRCRRWSAAEKMRMVEESLEPGASVSLVARRRGVNPNQIFTWRRLAAHGAFTAAAAGEEVVPPPTTARFRSRSANCTGCSARRRSRQRSCPRRCSTPIPKKIAAARATAAAPRFPVNAVARTRGVAQMVALVTGWSIFAIHRIVTWEYPLLGWRFVALRVLAAAPLPIIAGLLAELVLPVVPIGLGRP